MTQPRFDTYTDDGGDGRYRFVGGNGEKMAASEAYGSAANADRGVTELVVAILNPDTRRVDTNEAGGGHPGERLWDHPVLREALDELVAALMRRSLGDDTEDLGGNPRRVIEIPKGRYAAVDGDTVNVIEFDDADLTLRYEHRDLPVDLVTVEADR